jgi:aspartate aminotransferase
MAQSTQYELQLARRMSRLGTETAFEVLNKARALERQGKSIIHLEIGEPDFDTPANVVEAAVDALHKGWTHYGPSAGLPELRQTIADYVSRTRGVKVTPEEVVVVPGGKPIIFFTILTLIDEGDEVIYPNPGFPIYESMINYVGGRAVPIQLREERDFSLNVDELAALITDRTKLIILNSPQNPTGGVMQRKESNRLPEVIGDRNILVLSDEIYSRLLFEGEHFSIMSVPGMQERTILLDGFSKTYAMTGWRMGYGVMRADLAAHITRLMTNSNSCTASFTQMAGIEALRGDQSSGGSHVCRVQAPARRLRRGLESRSKAFPAACPKARSMSSPILPRRVGSRSRSPTLCWSRPEWQRFPARHSARSAKATCASAWPIRSKTCNRRWIASISGREESLACLTESFQGVRRSEDAGMVGAASHRRL